MPIVAPETNHRGYENPRRTLAGFSVGDLRTRFIDQCPSIHLLRVNGKKKNSEMFANQYYIILEQIFHTSVRLHQRQRDRV